MVFLNLGNICSMLLRSRTKFRLRLLWSLPIIIGMSRSLYDPRDADSLAWVFVEF